MPTKLINASLSEADSQVIEDAFAAVLAKLPFVINLTAEERKSGAKTGSDGRRVYDGDSVGIPIRHVAAGLSQRGACSEYCEKQRKRYYSQRRAKNHYP